MKIQKKINNFAVAHYPKIDNDKIIKADFALSNAACHFNAVASVNAGRADKVWLVWAGGNDGVVHFINSKSGKFFDETWCDGKKNTWNYRIVREIKRHEFDDVYDILCATKRAYWSMFGTAWEKYKSTKKLHGTF